MTRSSPDAASFAFEQLQPAASRAPAAAPARPRTDAATVLADAQVAAEGIREEARQAGHDEGFRAGMEQAAETLGPAAVALEEAAGALRRERAEAAGALERQAVELALAIAEKALQAAVEVQPERVADVVKGAMRLMVEREDVVLHVNPVDVDIVREALAGASEADPGRIEVVEERRVARGGAVLRTSIGEIDARLETKLERAAEVLRAELEA